MSPGHFQPQRRCLIRKNKVYQISPSQNECLVNFQQGLFHFKNGPKRSILLPAQYIPNLCSILDVVQRKDKPMQEMFGVVAALTSKNLNGKRIFLTAETNNGTRQSVKLVECDIDQTWPGYEIEFNLINVDLLRNLYLKWKLS